MTPMWQLFCKTGAVARDLLASPEVAERWNRPSALAEFQVRGLSGHLARQILNADRFLDVPLSSDVPRMDLGEWFAKGSKGKSDEPLDSPSHRAIRERAEQDAEGGPARLAAKVDAALARLATRLPGEDPNRWVNVFGHHALTLDTFLLTRLTELVVHTDDLAFSVFAEPPVLPEEAVDVVIGALTGHAVRKHGRVAVLRALSRSERAPGTISAY
ncbi:maleylpyruvate isomerase N-terminal domain-containing protein [Phytomonospora sp. NPDC050363]|uniref:maleylpyruvate isomerase N-terminal domain-containing protein n=1 Tax=Phytomonospora sp. NPDC050363 TaxID=3155642 RepID=UPI00340CD594